jgi:transcriptional regulator with XRE-family HTH domain
MMNAEMMKQQGADRSVLGSLYEMAVCLTVPHVEQTYQEGVPEKLLSVLEVNAILEYEYYRELADNTFTAKCRYWMAYVEDSLFDVLSKAKIYPKIVWYYLRETLAEYKTLDLTGLYDALQVCEQAVEMLRDTGRAYYLTELLDSRKQILDEMIHKLVEYGRRREAERYKRLLQESTALEELLKNLYTTYDVPVYMQDCTYLYRQRWVFAIGDVLRIRRNMLGMTQEQVCEGICSVKSLRRAEKKQANMQREPLGKILMRLGLSKVIQKTALVTNDRSVLHLHHELDVCRNNREPEKARALLGQMKNKLCLEIPENMQFVKECEASLDLMESRITGSEFVERVDEALRCTLKAEKIYDVDEVYLTETEMSCICNKAKEADETEKRELIDFMLGFFEKFKNKDLLSEYISMYEFVMVSVTNELSSLGEYQLAAALDKKGLREVLRCRRLWVINEFLYDLWWMDMQQKSVTRQEKEKMTNDLIQCVIISHFCKRRYYERFYMDTINQFSPVLEE